MTERNSELFNHRIIELIVHVIGALKITVSVEVMARTEGIVWKCSLSRP